MIGKIQKQHLDPKFLLELKTGSATGNLDDALVNYIKKTDIIEKKQINPDIFDSVLAQINDVKAMFANYRLVKTNILKNELGCQVSIGWVDIKNRIFTVNTII